MDFYQFLAFALVFVALGYLLGSYERTKDGIANTIITTPDNPKDVINNLRGQVKAQQMVMQKWVDEAHELGFDGVRSALESIRRHRSVKIHVIASAKGGLDAQQRVVSILKKPNKVGAP
jgi:hypothetical protein